MKAVHLIFAAAFLQTPLLAQALTVQMQRALYLEETAGDLGAAIQIYRQVLAAGAGARVYEAEAQFRLGACLLKEGDKPQAARAFQQLMQTHPEATGLAAQASTHFVDAEVGYSFTIPLGWSIKSRLPNEGRGTCADLQDPEHQGSVTICAKREAVSAANIDARMAQGEAGYVQRLREQFPDFTPRSGSPVVGALAGQHTLTLIADYTVGSERETRWTTWVQTEATRCSIAVRVPAQQLDDFRSRFTPILNSYRMH
jgi:hypothetical protein